ncbi:MAG: c-type cytochrome [Methylococcales bacterium]|nr:c-type cytochrome [Methylococcales bacterium]
MVNCSSCHGSNPKANSDHVLQGKDAGTIRDAIQKNKGGKMGILKDRINDAAIEAIAAYLRTF